MGEKIDILVIDDEPIVADALMTILSDSGYEVAIARTGLEGLGKLNRQRFAVTITDLQLPDISGLEVLSRIRQKDPNSFVIVITAHSTPEIIAESLRRGALSVLAKPFFPSDVLDLLPPTSTR
jgi:DNA-binding NtrC family response regulator